MTMLDLKDRVFGAGHRLMTLIGVIAGGLVALGQYLELVPPEFRTQKWYAVAAALVALGSALKLPAKNAAKVVGGALLLALAAPALGQVDPTAGTVDGAGMAAAVAEAAPDFRGGLVLGFLPGKPSLMPAVAISPFAVSLRDGKFTSGLTVGAGYQVLWNAAAPTARGVAAYASMRSTADGPRPLVSVLGVFTPYLGAGVGYQVGGGLASFRDSAMLLLSVGTNFGAVVQAK